MDNHDLLVNLKTGHMTEFVGIDRYIASPKLILSFGVNMKYQDIFSYSGKGNH